MPKKQENSSSLPPPRLQEKYKNELVAKLQKELAFSSPMRVPRIEKIVINRGVGIAVADKKMLEASLSELTLITGQCAVATRARRAISNFKLREGMPIGARVTLRSRNMYEFLDRLITVALPRVRDFQGISPKGFDRRGNYTLGIREQIVFPEISIDKVPRLSGMDITFVTTAQDDKEGFALLRAFGLPFKKN